MEGLIFVLVQYLIRKPITDIQPSQNQTRIVPLKRINDCNTVPDRRNTETMLTSGDVADLTHIDRVLEQRQTKNKDPVYISHDECENVRSLVQKILHKGKINKNIEQETENSGYNENQALTIAKELETAGEENPLTANYRQASAKRQNSSPSISHRYKGFHADGTHISLESNEHTLCRNQDISPPQMEHGVGIDNFSLQQDLKKGQHISRFQTESDQPRCDTRQNKEVFIMNPLVSPAAKDFEKALRDELKKTNIRTTEITTTHVRNLNQDKRLILICNYSSRLKTDVNNCMAIIKEDQLKNVILIVLHVARKDKLPYRSAKDQLYTSDETYKEIGDIVGIGFQTEAGIYKCPTNDVALQQIRVFLSRI